MPGHPFAPLRHRSVRLLWGAAVVSDIGTWVQLIVVGSLVAADSRSAVQTGLVALATFAPQGLSSPIGGLLADRYERRRVFATMLLAQAAGTGVLAVVLAAGERSTLVLTPLILAASAAGALGAPSYAAMLPDLVPEHEMMAMVSLGVYSWNSGRVVGPLLGSVLNQAVGPAWTVAFNAATFAVLATAVGLLRRRFVPSGEHGSISERLTTGWRALRSTTGCWHAVVILVLFNLTIVPFMGLIPIYARAVFDGDTSLAGTMSSAQGIGAIVGGIAGATLAHRISRSALTVGVIIYLGGALLAFAAAPNVPSAIAAAALLGGGASTMFIAVSAVVQRDAPESARGRVMALHQASMGTSYGAGLMLIGGIGDLFSLRVAFASGAALMAIGMVWLTWRSPRWRTAIDGEPAPRPLAATAV
jgi:MFS family permease